MPIFWKRTAFRSPGLPHAHALHAQPTHSEDILSVSAAHCRTTSTPCAALRLLFLRYSSEPKGAGGSEPVAGTRKRRQVLFFWLFFRAKLSLSPNSTAGRCCCCFFLSAGAEGLPAARLRSKCTIFPCLGWVHSWSALACDGSVRAAVRCLLLLLLLSWTRGAFDEEVGLKSVVSQVPGSSSISPSPRAPASTSASTTRGEEGDLLLAPLRRRKTSPTPWCMVSRQQSVAGPSKER